MTASETTSTTTRKRPVRRVFAWTAGIALCLLLAAVVLRAVLVRQMRWPRLMIAQDGCVTAVSVTPDGRTIFSGEGPAYDLPHFVQNQPRDVFVWSAADGRLISRLSGFHRIISTVTASPDGRHLIASGEIQWSIAGTTSFGTSFPTLNLIGCHSPKLASLPVLRLYSV